MGISDCVALELSADYSHTPIMSYSNHQLTQALQPYADSFNVALQPMYDDRVLDLYLNRPPELAANCPKLVAILKRQIARQFPEIRTLYLYSRVWGEETIDWEAQIEMPQLKPTPLPPPPPSPTPPQRRRSDRGESRPVRERAPRQNSTNNRSTPGGVRGSSKNRTQNQNMTSDSSHANSSGVSPSPETREVRQDETASARDRALSSKPTPEPDNFVLQKFCFSRNRRLVEGPLKNPEPDMAELIQFFHNLDEAGKRQLLPLLETWFKEPEKVDISSLPEATQTWLRKPTPIPNSCAPRGFG